MTYALTNEEKTGIVSQHLKNIEYSLYNLEMSLIEENSLSTPDSAVVTSLDDQIDELTAKKNALLAELATLTE